MGRRLIVPAYTVRSTRRLTPGARVQIRVRGRKNPEAGIVLQSKGADQYIVMRRRNPFEFADKAGDVVARGLGSTRLGRGYKKGMRYVMFPMGSAATKVIVTTLGTIAGFSVGPAGAIVAGAAMLGICEVLDRVTRENPRRNPHGQYFDNLDDPPGAYAVEEAARDEAYGVRGEGNATRLKRVRADAKALGLLAAYERGARRGFAEARQERRPHRNPRGPAAISGVRASMHSPLRKFVALVKQGRYSEAHRVNLDMQGKDRFKLLAAVQERDPDPESAAIRAYVGKAWSKVVRNMGPLQSFKRNRRVKR